MRGLIIELWSALFRQQNLRRRFAEHFLSPRNIRRNFAPSFNNTNNQSIASLSSLRTIKYLHPAVTPVLHYHHASPKANISLLSLLLNSIIPTSFAMCTHSFHPKTTILCLTLTSKAHRSDQTHHSAASKNVLVA